MKYGFSGDPSFLSESSTAKQKQVHYITSRKASCHVTGLM